ncbi:NYN domain-containing protein [Chengkuizengella sp. YPA3-1-1]|uniref:NYN domain-containing protein n=2 Tax=Chengkuizengella marina TaxID=2507566 RepID=A0A6N9Q661_9BACL|nr:NYN domain-containing protein [Chengkuizengella marina]NBI30332.1 NYN domain-containing protein [Chengkuizengella marina]
MMEEYLIVDGYNMVGSWPELIKTSETSLEEARNQLIKMLADYQGYSGMKIIVVFDAHQVPGIGVKEKNYKIKVIYTKEKETADECIERLVTELSHRKRDIHVATSDYVEQRVTFGKGALRRSARELWMDIQESRKKVEKKITKHTKKSSYSFDSKLSSDVKDIFEKWRRGEK